MGERAEEIADRLMEMPHVTELDRPAAEEIDAVSGLLTAAA